MNPAPITALYVALHVLVLLALSFRVVQLRMKHEVSLGDGGHPALLVAQRAQANFVEYVPLALLAIGAAEASGTGATIVHGLGAVLLLSRIAHPLGVAPEFAVRVPRGAGFFGTALVLVAACGLILWNALAS